MSTWAEYLAELQAISGTGPKAPDENVYSADYFYNAVLADREEDKAPARAAAEARAARLAGMGAMPTAQVEGARGTSLLEMAGRSMAGGGMTSTALAFADLGMLGADTAAQALAPDSAMAQWVDRDTDKLDVALRRALSLGNQGTLTQAADSAAQEARADYMAGGGGSRVGGALAGVLAPEVLGGLGAGAILNRAARKIAGESAEMAAKRALITGLADRGIDATTGGAVTAAMGYDGGGLGLEDVSNFGTGAAAGLVLGEGMRQGVGYLGRSAAGGNFDIGRLAGEGLTEGAREGVAGLAPAMVIPPPRTVADDVARAKARLLSRSAKGLAPPSPEGAAVGPVMARDVDQAWEMNDFLTRLQGALDDFTADHGDTFAKVTTAAKGAAPGPLDPPAVVEMKAELRRAAAEINTAALQVGGTKRLGELADEASIQGVDPLDHLDAPEMLEASQFLSNPPDIQKQLNTDALSFAASGSGSPLHAATKVLADELKIAKGMFGAQLSLEGQLIDPAAVAVMPRMISEEIKGRTNRRAAQFGAARDAWQSAVKKYARKSGQSAAKIDAEIHKRTQYGPEQAKAAVKPVVDQLAKVTSKEDADAQVLAAWNALSTGNPQALQGLDPGLVQAMQASIDKWGVPTELQPAWLQTVKALETLRDTGVKIGMFDQQAAAKVMARGAAYLYRSYDASYDPVGQLAKAKQMPEYGSLVAGMHKRLPSLSLDEIMAKVDDLILGDRKARKTVLASLPTGPSGKPTITRQDLNEPLRKLKGERFNFSDEAAHTNWLVSEQVARHEVMQNFAETAERLGVAQRTQAPGFKPLDIVRPDEEVSNPTGGLYFREDIVKALELPLGLVDTANSLSRWAQFGSAAAEGYANTMKRSRAAKIAFNVPSLANQFYGDTIAAIAGTPILNRLVSDPKGSLRNFTMASIAALDAASKGKFSRSKVARLSAKAIGITPQQLDETINIAADRGIIRSGALLDLMREVDPRRSVTPTKPRVGTSSDPILEGQETIGRMFDAGLSVAKRAGGALDAALAKPGDAIIGYGVAPYLDLLKVWGMRAHMDEVAGDLRSVLKASGADPATIEAVVSSPENRKFVVDVATERMKENTPAPQRLPEFIQKLDRYSPIVPWIKPMLEPVRNIGNVLKQAAQSQAYSEKLVKQAQVVDSPAARKAAALSTTRAYGNVARVATAVGALSLWAKSQQDGDIPEEQALAAKELVKADYELLDTMAILEYQPGVGVRTRNYGTVDVTDFPRRMMAIGMEGLSTGDVQGAAGRIAREFTSFQPAVEAALEAVTGYSFPGDLTTALQRGVKPIPVTERVSKPLSTLLPGTAKRLLEGDKAGLRRFDDSLYYDALDANSLFDRMRNDARAEAAMVVDTTKLPELKAKYDARWKAILSDMHESVHRARLVQLPEESIDKQIKRGFNRLNVRGKAAATNTEEPTSLWDIYRWEDFTAPPKDRG